MTRKKLISIIVPVFNERENIDALFVKLNPILDSLAEDYEFEILFTDNHSTDGTFDRLAEMARDDPRIRVMRFSRNFGYQKSILTGYLHARGEAAVQLDADLQDPPELIREFIRLWEEGNEVIYGIRRSRDEGWFIHSARKAFYSVISWLSETGLPLNAGDFRLIDRKIIDLLGRLKDSNPYLRGTIATLGFSQVGVPYDREARKIGKSKISMRQYVQIAIDGIVSQSVFPLRVATYVGLAISVIMFMGIIFLLVGQFIFGATWPRGFATTTLMILFGISLNALFLGIIGEYMARIYRQSIDGPLTILEKTIPDGLEANPTIFDARISGDR